MRTPWQAIRDKFVRPVYIYNDRPVITVDGVTTEELYATQPNLRSVVSFLMCNFAQLPLKVYSIDEDGGRVRDRNSPAALLMRKPNPTQTMYEFKSQLMGELCLYDACYTVLAPDAESASGWRWQIIPNPWVRRDVGHDPFDIEYIDVMNQYGGHTRIDAESLVVFHGWNPMDPRTGISPVEALKATLEEQISAVEFRRFLWENGGRFGEYVSRPKDVERWEEPDIKRFKEEFKEHWTGNRANGEGIPVLEDGMEVKSVQFNSKEAQWLESVELSMKTCCQVFGVKPAMITGEGQTYASVKENARSLYNDILGPKLTEVQERVTEFVLPKIGEPSSKYAEFDMSAKLAGSFEEQADVLSKSTGAPWMLRSEARDRMNLPHVDVFDDPVTPLNVLMGGLASPRDTGDGGYSSAPVSRVMLVNGDMPDGSKSRRLKARGHPRDEDVDEICEMLSRFFARQRKSVLAALGAKADGDWWDAERWDAELADDLAPIMLSQSAASARRGLRRLELDPDDYDVGRTEAYISKVAAGRARGINEVTKRALDRALAGEVAEGAEGSTPSGVFDVAEESRAKSSAGPIAAMAVGWGLMEGMRQCAGRRRVTKTWIHVPSANPRPEHMAMDGETVDFADRFSNGAAWPGDTSALDADEIANCNCEIEVSIDY